MGGEVDTIELDNDAIRGVVGFEVIARFRSNCHWTFHTMTPITGLTQCNRTLFSLKRKVSCIAMRDWQGTNKKDEGCVTVCVSIAGQCVSL